MKFKKFKFIFVFLFISLVNINYIFGEKINIYFPYSDEYPVKHINLDEDLENEVLIALNQWNVDKDKTKGSSVMSYLGEGIFETNVNFTDIVKKDKNDYILGFPEIYYGRDLWNKDRLANGFEVILPKKIKELDSFYVSLNYELDVPKNNAPFNLAFESWLVSDLDRENGAENSDVEMMVWFYFNNLNPAGEKIYEKDFEISVDGILTNKTFEIYLDDMGWKYFTFRIKEPIENGNIIFNYKRFIDELNLFFKNKYDNYYLFNVEVGTEYSLGETDDISFFWRFSNFNLFYDKSDIEYKIKQDEFLISNYLFVGVIFGLFCVFFYVVYSIKKINRF